MDLGQSGTQYHGSDPANRPRVVIWGTYDLGKPRVRILLDAARRAELELTEIHADVWKGIEDKSRINGRRQRLWTVARWLFAYPGLMLRYLRAAPHDMVFVPYMGHLDVVLLRPLARLRRAPILWDALLTLHGTVVEDRRMLSERSWKARLLRGLDKLAFGSADRLLTGTAARAEQYVSEYGVGREKIETLFVSAELQHFAPTEPAAATIPTPDTRPMALFYGQFAPLHGLESVIEAARSSAGQRFDWVFIGTGQEGWRLADWIERDHPSHVHWIDWVAYESLRDWIARADICLGSFGASRKAATGLSNKLFQIVASGKPLLTRDSPAIRELFDDGAEGLFLVPPENPAALTTALESIEQQLPELRRRHFHAELLRRLGPEAIAAGLHQAIIHTIQAEPPSGDTTS